MEVVLINAQLLGLILHNLLIRHDNSDRSDVLATLHLDKVLHTIKNPEVTLLIELSDITGLEPTIRGESLLGLLRVVPVLGHNGQTPDPDLTLGNLGLGGVAQVRERNELDVASTRSRANGVRRELKRAAQRAIGACLSETITGQHGSNDQRNEILCAVRNTTGAIHSEAHTTTCQFTDLAKYEAVEQPSEWQLVLGSKCLPIVGTPEQVLEKRASSLQLGGDTLPDGFPDLRNTDHDGGLELAHITSTVLHRRIRQCSRVAVSERTTDVHDQVFEGHFEDMGQGEVGKNALLVAYTFFDTVKVFWLGRVGLDRVLFAELAELLEGDDFQVRVVCLELLELASLGKDGSVVDDDDLD
ncbi:hypothetical protein HG531_005299 [Fusarium graminearum]|nr:hypothetical protein HG531_005299 [Fusarium graminearum]